MLTILLGKTCSGKTTIRNELIKHGKKPIITYTTRPIRSGEVDGETYHYISEDEFMDKIDDGFFAEWKEYHTAEGVWYYGSSKCDFEDAADSVIILTPAGYDDFRAVCSDIEHKALYIYANNKTIKGRLVLRGDSKEEAQRRLEHDNADFKGLENKVDRIFYNNFNQDMNKLIEIILNFIQ